MGAGRQHPPSEIRLGVPEASRLVLPLTSPAAGRSSAQEGDQVRRAARRDRGCSGAPRRGRRPVAGCGGRPTSGPTGCRRTPRRRRTPGSPDRGSLRRPGHGDLDRWISVIACLSPAVSISQAVLSTSSRALLELDAATRRSSPDHALIGQRSGRRRLPVGRPLTQLQRAFADADGSHAVVDPARARAGPARSRTVTLAGDQVRRPAPGRRRTRSRRGRRAGGRRSRRR